MEDKNLQTVEKDIEQFKLMVQGATELVKPWRLALILSNLFWAVVLALFIFLAYLSPASIETNQEQTIPSQSQAQTVKGGS